MHAHEQFNMYPFIFHDFDSIPGNIRYGEKTWKIIDMHGVAAPCRRL